MEEGGRMKPYFQDAAVTIYHGDCREVLPQIERAGAMITDPPYSPHTHAKQWIGAALTASGDKRTSTAHKELGFEPLTEELRAFIWIKSISRPTTSAAKGCFPDLATSARGSAEISFMPRGIYSGKHGPAAIEDAPRHCALCGKAMNATAQLTADHLRIRDTVRAYFGDRWADKVDRHRSLFAGVMSYYKCDPIEAVTHISRAAEIPTDKAAALLIAVAVELTEERT